MIKDGTIWESGDKKFMVLHTIELEGNLWVHYREHTPSKPALECREYSCYQESFLQRFRQLPT